MDEANRPQYPSQNTPQSQQVHLLFRERPEINEERLLEALRRHVGPSEIAQGDQPGLRLFFFTAHTLGYKDGQLPAQGQLLMPPEGQIDLGRFETARQQSWHWPGAFEEVKAAQHEFFISDFLSQHIPAPIRMRLLSGFARAMTEALRPDALYFVQGDRLENPRDFLQAHPEEETLHGFVNVRLFRIAEDGLNSLFMDTLGLQALGLPDFEIYFSTYPANEVANKLLDYAYYLMEEGPVVGDGNEMEGLEPNEIWTARRMEASVGPEREVIRIENKDYHDLDKKE